MSAFHMTPSGIRRQSSPAMPALGMSIPLSSCRCRISAMSVLPHSSAKYTRRCKGSRSWSLPSASVTCLGWCRCAPCRHHVAEKLAVLQRRPARHATGLMRVRNPLEAIPEPLTVDRRHGGKNNHVMQHKSLLSPGYPGLDGKGG